MTYPHWGGQAKAATALPPLTCLPRHARFKPSLDNHGVSLCIFLPGQEQPFKIMENFTNFDRPAWIPDGQRIAVSAKGRRSGQRHLPGQS